MEWTPVRSSSIESIGYDRETQTLGVAFMSGAVYQYAGVSEEVFKEFLRTESKGSFFQSKIRSNYDFTCIQPRKKKEESHAEGESETAKASAAKKKATKRIS